MLLFLHVIRCGRKTASHLNKEQTLANKMMSTMCTNNVIMKYRMKFCLGPRGFIESILSNCYAAIKVRTVHTDFDKTDVLFFKLLCDDFASTICRVYHIPREYSNIYLERLIFEIIENCFDDPTCSMSHSLAECRNWPLGQADHPVRNRLRNLLSAKNGTSPCYFSFAA